jgi:hypothetical protein
MLEAFIIEYRRHIFMTLIAARTGMNGSGAPKNKAAVNSGLTAGG